MSGLLRVGKKAFFGPAFYSMVLPIDILAGQAEIFRWPVWARTTTRLPVVREMFPVLCGTFRSCQRVFRRKEVKPVTYRFPASSSPARWLLFAYIVEA